MGQLVPAPLKAAAAAAAAAARPAMDESPRVRRFDEVPSSDEFSSTIEPQNVPAVFKGAVKNWEAISKWDPANGGLDYLEETVGSANVEAMLSNSAPAFYGDIRSHERVSLPFTTFTSSCKLYVQNAGGKRSSSIGQEESSMSQVNSKETCSASLDTSDQIYLAQVPIFSTESNEKFPLEVLSYDIPMPAIVATKKITAINLWMNRAGSRSSTHYDPYHNLLCIVAGCKQVVLWPPSACPLLYPMAIHGESSNHSAVDLENPDLSIHARAKYSREYSQKIILHSGDALFIPEGWFHQVDSDDLTIAVNFWWKSNIMSNMLEHMDAYYLRRLLNRLVGKEMDYMVQMSSVSNLEGRGKCKNANEGATSVGVGQNSMPQTRSVNNLEGREKCDDTSEGSKGWHAFGSDSQMENVSGSGENHWPTLQKLEPFALGMLYELIYLVHDAVKVGGTNERMQCPSLKESVVSLKSEHRQSTMGSLPVLSTDPIAGIFFSVEPLVLKSVLLAMAHQFPRTLEALIMHVLSPIGAEVLTRKFDEMDQQMTKEQQIEFYQIFYSVFDNPNAAMDVILKRKEAFAFQAVQNVLDQYLGLHVTSPNSSSMDEARFKSETE